MITLTTEQAQLIEDALENWFAQTPDTSHLDIKLFVLDTKQALSIIRAARAHEQAEQEPVAERFEKMHANGDVWITTLAAAAIARNASPVRTKDLTDDEIGEIVHEWLADTESGYAELISNEGFARAVIAADREKNR